MESTVLNKKCPFCAELILAEARKCRYCGEMLDMPRAEGRPPTSATSHPSLDPVTLEQGVAKGITQAHKDYKVRNVLGFEILALASIIGFSKQSWLVFGVVFIILSACLAFRPLRVVILVAFSLFWGFVAFGIGAGLFSSTPAGIVLGTLAFLVSYGVHDSSARWMRS